MHSKSSFILSCLILFNPMLSHPILHYTTTYHPISRILSYPILSYRIPLSFLQSYHLRQSYPISLHFIFFYPTVSYAILFPTFLSPSQCTSLVVLLSPHQLNQVFSFNPKTYFIFGKRSETIPLNNFRSSKRNFGTFTSRIARKTISS